MKGNMKKILGFKPGFTLIELLISIGIILILAGIAWENYIVASIRSKNSRVLAEHRTIATAIESYHVDRNAYPRMASRQYGDRAFDFVMGVPVSGVLSKSITTPVAYLSTSLMFDPFMLKNADAPLDERLYTYQVISEYQRWNPESTFWPKAREYYGEWRLGSVGPDQVFDHSFINSAQLLYDPTNGLISLGNIWTSHNQPSTSPPVPDLVGEH